MDMDEKNDPMIRKSPTESGRPEHDPKILVRD